MALRAKLHLLNATRKENASRQLSCRVEPLEGRTLLSAWSTVAAGSSINGGDVQSMATDAAGNVYAVGSTTDANPNDAGIPMVWEKPAGGSWQQFTSVPFADAVIADKQGNIFFTGQYNNDFTTWELANGSSTVVTIDSYYNGGAQGRGLAFDSSGNLYAVGSDAPLFKGVGYPHFLTRKGTFANGKWSFSTVDEMDNKLQIMDTAYSVVVAPSGVYVAGLHAHTWTVRGSATGAAGTWTTVDSFYLDSSANSSARAITVDSAGHLYVAGTAQTTTLIPGSRPKAYHLTNWWIVRESNSGAAGTWSTIDNSQNWSPAVAGGAWAIAPDAAGDIYAAGSGYVTNAGESGIVRVRSAATGTWSTSDVTPFLGFDHALTVDTFGNIYTGGESGDGFSNLGDYFIRSLPAAPTNLTASPDAAAPSSQINLSWTNAAGSDQTGFAIYRSSDGGKTFTLVTTVGAGVTSFNDIGLAAGTTYTYYVVTLLNSDGASAQSNTVAASTAP